MDRIDGRTSEVKPFGKLDRSTQSMLDDTFFDSAGGPLFEGLNAHSGLAEVMSRIQNLKGVASFSPFASHGTVQANAGGAKAPKAKAPTGIGAWMRALLK